MNHYPHHLGDYATGTQGFTQADHGAYRLLMDSYYSTEKPIPADDVYAISKAGTPAERKATEKVLTRKFALRDGLYHHKRIDEELEAYRQRAEVARENGKKGGRKPTRNPAGIPQRTDERSQTDTRSEPTSEAELKLASSHKPVNPQPGKAQHSGVGDITADPERLAALTAIFESDGRAELDAKARMHLRQFAAEGVTDQQLADAMAIARERAPLPKVLYAGLVASILPDVRSGTARRSQAGVSPEEFLSEGLRRIAAIEARDAAKGGQHGPN